MAKAKEGFFLATGRHTYRQAGQKLDAPESIRGEGIKTGIFERSTHTLEIQSMAR